MEENESQWTWRSRHYSFIFLSEVGQDKWNIWFQIHNGRKRKASCQRTGIKHQNFDTMLTFDMPRSFHVYLDTTKQGAGPICARSDHAWQRQWFLRHSNVFKLFSHAHYLVTGESLWCDRQWRRRKHTFVDKVNSRQFEWPLSSFSVEERNGKFIQVYAARVWLEMYRFSLHWRGWQWSPKISDIYLVYKCRFSSPIPPLIIDDLI